MIGQPVDKLSEATANKAPTVLLREQSGDPNATLDTPFAIVVVLLAPGRVAKGPAWTLVESHGVPRREAFKSVAAYSGIALAKEDAMARPAPSATAPPTVQRGGTRSSASARGTNRSLRDEAVRADAGEVPKDV